MVDISKHPLLKQAYDLGCLIEKLPASSEQTNASAACSALLHSIDSVLFVPRNIRLDHAERIADEFIQEYVSPSDSDGYEPSDDEKFLIRYAIFNLLENQEFIDSLQPVAEQTRAEVRAEAFDEAIYACENIRVLWEASWTSNGTDREQTTAQDCVLAIQAIRDL